MAHTNRVRVILGGLLAGVVINIVEYITNGVVLKQAWGEAMKALGKPAELTPGDIQRYSRHLILPEVGVEGQQKLKAASVLLIGAGGLGSPAGLYLAAAGVGHLGIVDFDAVDFSNLQRQILHGTADVGRSKLQSARDRLLAAALEQRPETMMR